MIALFIILGQLLSALCGCLAALVAMAARASLRISREEPRQESAGSTPLPTRCKSILWAGAVVMEEKVKATGMEGAKDEKGDLSSRVEGG
jgi:hypothetical protein